MTETCNDSDFCGIAVRRAPKCDKYYTEGKIEMDWNNSEDRLALVKEYDFRCEYIEGDDCEDCPAKDYCGLYEEWIEENKEGE